MSYRQTLYPDHNQGTQDPITLKDAQKLYCLWTFTSYVQPHHQLPIAGRQGQEVFLVIPMHRDKFVGGWIFSADQQYRSGNLIQLTNPHNLGNELFSTLTKPRHGTPIRTGIALPHRWIP